MSSLLKKSTTGISAILVVGALALGGTTAQAASPGQAPHRAANSGTAAGPQAYTCVIGDRVHFRSGPGTNFPSLGQVNRGQGFNITGSSGNWRQGNLWGGPTGVWISNTYLGTCA